MKKLIFLFCFISSFAFGQSLQTTGGYNTSLSSGFTGILPIANGGTASSIATGTGQTVLNTSPTFTTSIGVGTSAGGSTTALTTMSSGTTSATYMDKMLNSASTQGNYFRSDGFVGLGQDSSSELVTDVNDANPATLTYNWNAYYDQNAATQFKITNKNTGTSAYTRILIGNMRKSRYLTLASYPAEDSVSSTGILRGTAFLASGSGLINGLQLYADNGMVAIGTNTTTSTGVADLVVGQYPNCYVGIGTRYPSYPLHITRSVAGGGIIYNVNTSNNSASYSGLISENDNGKRLNTLILSSAYTTDGLFKAETGLFNYTGTDNLVTKLGTTSNSAVWCLGGNLTTNERFRIANTYVSVGVAGTQQGNLVLNGATSQSVTLTTLATAGNVTATFPAATGTVMISGNATTTNLTDVTAPTTYTATITGFSGTPTQLCQYSIEGKTMAIWWSISGTSNATTLTITIPGGYTASNPGTINYSAFTRVTDNGTAQTVSGILYLPNNSSTIQFYKDNTGAAFTNSGTKAVYGYTRIPIQ